MSELSILNQLVAAGMTSVGACAMAGNMQAESGFKANVAQRGMTKLSDEEYTAKADSSSTNFVNDGVGYGLCQWTYSLRKADLWNYAHGKGKSVGDENIQVQFCIAELKTDYPSLWGYLCEAQDLAGATTRICKEFERPAVNNIITRIDFANRLYTKYRDQLHRTPDTDNVPGIQNESRMPVIKRYDDSAEVKYLANKLSDLGYQVLWDGLYACLVDYQDKMGLDVDGICGEKTWEKLLK